MKIILDEHFPQEVSQAVRREFPAFNIESIHSLKWEGLLDPALLEILDQNKTTILTRDVNTIPQFISSRLAEGKTHGGVIYVPRSIAQDNLKEVISRLVELIKKRGAEDWTCQTAWL